MEKFSHWNVLFIGNRKQSKRREWQEQKKLSLLSDSRCEKWPSKKRFVMKKFSWGVEAKLNRLIELVSNACHTRLLSSLHNNPLWRTAKGVDLVTKRHVISFFPLPFWPSALTFFCIYIQNFVCCYLPSVDSSIRKTSFGWSASVIIRSRALLMHQKRRSASCTREQTNIRRQHKGQQRGKHYLRTCVCLDMHWHKSKTPF